MEAEEDPVGVGSSAAWRGVRAQVRALAPLRVPVWIEGEAGSGRDLVAAALHRLGVAPDRRFARLREFSQLGTAAFERAATLYMEHPESFGRSEIAGLQAWLQRRPEDSRPRVLIAALRDAPDGIPPSAEESLGRFRIELPALRERLEDLPELVRAMAERVGARIGRKPGRLTPGALEFLRAQRWRGNLRELENVIEQALAFSIDGDLVRSGVERAVRNAPPAVAVERRRRRDAEREELLRLIAECGGNLAEVARRLDLSRGAVLYRARKHGLVAGPLRVRASQPALRPSCDRVAACGSSGGGDA